MKPVYIFFLSLLFFSYQAAATIEITGITHNYSEAPPEIDCRSGSIDLTAQGNAGPFSFNWSNGATTEDVNRLCSGDYSVTVTNKFGCTKVLYAQVIDCRFYSMPPPSITITNFKITSLSAVGASDGAIDLTVTGGFSQKYFKWTREGSTTVIATTEDISGLSDGTYCVTISGDCDGGTSACYTIRHCPSMSWTITPSIKPDCDCRNCWFCNNACRKGSISLTVTAPYGPKTFRWSNGTTSNPAKDLVAGDYAVTITDLASGCTTTRTFNIAKKLVVLENLGNCAQRALCGEDVIKFYQGEVHRELELRTIEGRELCVQQQYCDDTPVEGAWAPLGAPIKEVDFDFCKGVKKCKNGFEEKVVATALGERTVGDEDQNCEARIRCKITWPDGTISDTTYTTINWTHCKLIVAGKCNEWKYCEKLGFYGNKSNKVWVGAYATGEAGYGDCNKLDECPAAIPPMSMEFRQGIGNAYISVIPNPFSDHCNLFFEDVEKGTILKVGIFDLLGHIVFQKEIRAEATTGNIRLDFGKALPSGSYRLSVSGESTDLLYQTTLVHLRN